MLTGSLREILTNNFADLFKLDYLSFIKIIQKCIPESAYLKGKAQTSAEGLPETKSNKDFYSLTEDEEIRAFSGLLRLKDVINGTREDYDNFVACQIQMKKPVLTYDSFQKMREYVLKTLKSTDDFAAAIWSILCNDLGKVHRVIEEYNKLSNKQTTTHDLLLSEMLKELPEFFPGFMNLPETYRDAIIKGYASGCDISQFEQLELPIVALKALTSLDKQALDLYIIHTIFDVSGAAAHFKSNGSLTLHEETWNFFNEVRACLETMPYTTIDKVYAAYLQYRGECIGVELTTPESTALIRLAGIARLATPEQGKLLLEVWEKIPDNTKTILTNELNVHGGENKRAIFIGYGVSILLNPQSALQKALSEESKKLNVTPTADQIRSSSKEGLMIGLNNLASAFKLARNIIGSDTSKEIFSAECDAVARYLSQDPRGSLDMDFQVVSQNKNHADFKLVVRGLENASQIETPKVSAGLRL